MKTVMLLPEYRQVYLVLRYQILTAFFHMVCKVNWH